MEGVCRVLMYRLAPRACPSRWCQQCSWSRQPRAKWGAGPPSLPMSFSKRRRQMTGARLHIKPLSTPWRLRAACSSRLWDFFSCTSTTARSCSRPGSVCVCVCVCLCVHARASAHARTHTHTLRRISGTASRGHRRRPLPRPPWARRRRRRARPRPCPRPSSPPPSSAAAWACS